MRFSFDNTVIEVNLRDQAALEAAIRGRLAAGAGFALATINLDHLDKLARDVAFRQAYAAHDFVVADGNPIVWLSRLARRPVALLPGADLVPMLCGWAAQAGAPVALVGATQGALARAAEALQRAIPGLEIAAQIAPPMGFAPDEEAGAAVIDALREVEAGLCLLALGAPRQERFAARARGALPQMGFASIGAGLDFLAGHQRRAPRLVRALALEWLWRALSSPARLGPRYARNAAQLPGHIRRALALRRMKENGDP